MLEASVLSVRGYVTAVRRLCQQAVRPHRVPMKVQTTPMADALENDAGVSGASITIAPWEHPLVWEFVGKGRYLQAAFCKSAAQLYSVKFGTLTCKRLSNRAAEEGFIGLLEWSKEIGCCWDESVFRSGAFGGRVDLLKCLWLNDCPIQRDTDLCYLATAFEHLEALIFFRERCSCVWDKRFCEAIAKEGLLEILQYAHAMHPHCPEWDSPGWDGREVCRIAAERGHIHILEWAHDALHEDGLFDARTCRAAAYGGRLDSLQYLRRIGCEWDGHTCQAAISTGHVDVLEWALDEGCPWDVNDTWYKGRTALHHARYEGMIEFLISCGADINAVDIRGRTPIHFAVAYGEIGVVMTFVRAGADVNKANIDGKTPLDRAIMHGYGAIAEALRAAGARESA